MSLLYHEKTPPLWGGVFIYSLSVSRILYLCRHVSRMIVANHLKRHSLGLPEGRGLAHTYVFSRFSRTKPDRFCSQHGGHPRRALPATLAMHALARLCITVCSDFPHDIAIARLPDKEPSKYIVSIDKKQ